MAFDADKARYDRMNRLNQPDFAPGQSQMQSTGGTNMSDPFANNTGFQDPFANASGGFQDPFANAGNGNLGGTIDPFANTGALGGGLNGGFNDPFASPAPTNGGFNDPFGGVGMGMGGGNGFGGGQQTPQQPKSTEDAFFDATAKGAKASVGFIKELVSSFGNNTALYWVNFGQKVTWASAVVVVVGIIAKLFGLKVGLNISIGAIFSAIVGVGCWFLPIEQAKQCTSMYKDEDAGATEPDNLQPQPDMMGNDFFGQTSNDDLFGGQSSDDLFGDSNPEDDIFSSTGSSTSFDFSDEDEEEVGYDDDEDEIDWNVGASTPKEPVRDMTTEQALATMPQLAAGVYTRQFLYERFSAVLPSVNPNFDKVQVIEDADNDEFLRWGEMLREAGNVTGLNEDNLPELLEVKKNIFTVVLTSDRPKGIKADLVGDELAKIYGFNAYQQGLINEEEMHGVYAKVMTVGTRCIFTIYTGKTAMVSLKDMMNREKDFILNTDNFMPVIIGINETGKVIKADLRRIESVVIAGMPRSGKTWLAQAILAQMCAFVPPSELQIYVCDPKGDVSDFKKFYLPHVKKFVSDDNKIVATLDYVINDLAPRRKKLIGDAGFVNIWDFKKAHPEVKIPSVIYIVMDELVTLAERMDKDTKSHFQKQLITIITQFPNLGIRAFLVPHVIKNDIIAKTATDTIDARISVRGTADHIEQTTGTKPKDFTYKLPNTGDMAVRIPQINQSTFYAHGTILTTSNPENDQLFDYLRQVWAKLEPDEIKGSRADLGAKEVEDKDILANLNNLDDEPISFDELPSENSQTSSVFNNINDNGLSSFNEQQVKNSNSDDEDGDFFDMF